MKIGLIADTHIPEACDRLPAGVFEAFRGVDLVMHAGDVYVNRVLDELAEIAPVIAAIGNGDEGLDGHRFKLEPDERVKIAHLLEVEGVRIGDYIHQLATLRLRVGEATLVPRPLPVHQLRRSPASNR